MHSKSKKSKQLNKNGKLKIQKNIENKLKFKLFKERKKQKVSGNNRNEKLQLNIESRRERK